MTARRLTDFDRASRAARIRSSRRFSLHWFSLHWLSLYGLCTMHAAASEAPVADFAAIDAYVDSQRAAQHIPGAALALVAPDGTIHVGGFGVTDVGGVTVTAQTPFVLGSTSKSFTALAVMQLVEAGQVELDAPVQRYLPWFRVADERASATITVRHLLNQTSGLPTAAGRRTLMDYASGDDALENRVRSLRDVALTTPVGRVYQYSNCNYQALGVVVQTVSGRSFEDYLKEHVFAPLEMRNTYTSKDEAVRNGLTIGHRSVLGRAVAFDERLPRGSVPSGFIVSTAQDMSHYLSAQLNGGRFGDARVLSAAGIDELHRGAARIGDGDVYYAMGWNVGALDGQPAAWHGGDTFGYQSFMVLLTNSRWGAVLLANMNDIPANGRFAEITENVLRLATGRAPAREHVHDSKVTHAIVFAIVALQALGIAHSTRMLRRLRQIDPPARPRGVAAAARLALPSLLNLAWASLILIAMPILFAPLRVLTLAAPGPRTPAGGERRGRAPVERAAGLARLPCVDGAGRMMVGVTANRGTLRPASSASR